MQWNYLDTLYAPSIHDRSRLLSAAAAIETTWADNELLMIIAMMFLTRITGPPTGGSYVPLIRRFQTVEILVAAQQYGAAGKRYG